MQHPKPPPKRDPKPPPGGLASSSPGARDHRTRMGVAHLTLSFACLVAAIAWWPIGFVLTAIVALLGGFYLVWLGSPFLVILLLVVQTALNLLGLYFGVSGLLHAVRSRYRILMTVKALLISAGHLGLLAGVVSLVAGYWWTGPTPTTLSPPPYAWSIADVVSPVQL